MSAPETEKRRLRHLAAERTDALGPAYLRRAGAAAAEHLAALPEYRAARTVLAFAGTVREMDTGPLLERVLTDGKTLALPVCTGPGLMEARQVTDLTALRPGRYGILEPPAGAPLLLPGELDLLVVPCAACDRFGVRLGRGGGYYDRYLANCGGLTAALCPQALVLDRVPREDHDRTVDIIVTETGARRAEKDRED